MRSARAACLAALLCGCTAPGEYFRNGFKVGPNFRRPPAEASKDWIDASDTRVRKSGESDAAWWKALNDSKLDALIDDAYRQNLTLREAGWRVLTARSKLDYSIGNLFPQKQEAVGGYSRNALSREVANRPYVSEPYYNQWQFGAEASWELDFWGRFRRAIEQSSAQLDASVDNYDDVLVTLLADVANSYVEYRTIEQQLVYVRANVALQRQTLDIARARFQSGESAELDVDQAQSTLSQTEAQVPQLDIRSRQANNRLCVLLGVPTIDLRPRLSDAPIPTAPNEVVVGIPADLLRRRPDVRREERLAAAQCAAVGIAESDFYPAISIIGNLGWQAQHFDDAFQSRAFEASVSPSYAWKVLNYGRLLSVYHLEAAQFQQMVASYENAVLTANAEVEDGIVRFLKSQQQATALAESVSAAEKAVQVSLAQYKAGMVDFNRVSLLEQNLVQQQDQLAQAKGNIALGLVATYRALGGGWQIRERSPADLKFDPAKMRDDMREWPAADYKPSPTPGVPSDKPADAAEPSGR